MQSERTEVLTLRYMTLADLDAVVRIEKASFTSPWSRRAFIAELSQNRLYSHVFVALLDDRVVGFLCFHYVINEAHIINLAVDPRYRRQGIGRRLLQHVLTRARDLGIIQVGLEVRASNQAAQALYSQLGFQTLGVRRRFYTDNGEDAYVMVWSDAQRR